MGLSKEVGNMEFHMKEHDNNTSLPTPITLSENSDQPIADHTKKLHPQREMLGQNHAYQPRHPVPVQNLNVPLSPLQLVYLQPAPFGFNIIPVQTATAAYPSYPQFSPVGLPTFQQFPQSQQSVGHMTQPYQNSQGCNVPYFYPAPGYVNHMNSNPMASPIYSYDVTTNPKPDTQDNSKDERKEISRPQHKLFRPWEDRLSLDIRETNTETLGEHHKCEGEDVTEQGISAKDQSRQAVIAFSETDFPALDQELSNMKIRN